MAYLRITARFSGTCRLCGCRLRAGESVNFEPGTKGVFCLKCIPDAQVKMTCLTLCSMQTMTMCPSGKRAVQFRRRQHTPAHRKVNPFSRRSSGRAGRIAVRTIR